MTTENRHSADDPLEEYFDDFGDSLRDAIRARERRGTPRRGIVYATAVAVSICVLLVLVVTGPAGHRSLDLVDQAQAALRPPDEIVHMTVTQTFSEGQGTVTQTAEQWSATSPTRWRLVQNDDSDRAVMHDDSGQIIHGREEFSYADGVLRRLLVERNVLDVADSTSTEGPGLFGLPNRGDPGAELRTALTSGSVRDGGEFKSGGRTLRRLIGDSGQGAEAHHFVYDVDAETFAPINGRLTIARSPEEAITFHVDSYERLPLTQQNAKLLSITTNADTTVRNQKAP